MELDISKLDVGQLVDIKVESILEVGTVGDLDRLVELHP